MTGTALLLLAHCIVPGCATTNPVPDHRVKDTPQVVAKTSGGPEDFQVFSRALGDAARLSREISFPFEFRSSSMVKSCERSVKSEAGVAPFVKCLKDQWFKLLEDLKVVGFQNPTEAKYSKLPRYAQKLLKVDTSATYYTAWCNGDGVTYSFVLVKRNSRQVAGLIVDMEFPQ